jgi:outer membrane protein assembly factor BamD (BamD/ComL family)
MPFKCRVVTSLALSAAVLFSFSVCAASREESFAQLPELNLLHPYCGGAANLSLSSEYFVEIANELPGKAEYNQLIQLYQGREWARLKASIDHFRKIYETSPLLEAVAFLEVQSEFDRFERENIGTINDAERLLREVLLLYPKSTLVPILNASIAGFWLRAGQYTKALAMYELGKREYKDHDLHCIYAFGSAEASYQIGDLSTGRPAFEDVLKKCQNPRVRVGAGIRLADMLLEKKPKEAKAAYEKIFYQNGPIINHFYPSLLFNMGEMKYREKQYASSRFFFTEYLRRRSKEETCQAYALKRLADIAYYGGEKRETAIGLYLSVREEVPRNDVARFSYIHGLLLELKKVNEPERERRIKVVDEELEKIKSEHFRALGYLEKGLALVEVGEKEALDYLVRLNQKTTFNLNNGALGSFVREKLLNILKADSEGAAAKPSRKEALKDQRVLGPIESAFPIWLKSTSYEAKARELYSNFVIRRFKESLERKHLPAALDKLARWKNSELWPAKGPSTEQVAAVGIALTKYFSLFQDQKDEADLKEAAETLRRHETEVAPFLTGDFGVILGAARRWAKDEKELATWLSKNSSNRKLASLPGKIPTEARFYLHLQQGLNFWAGRRFKEADAELRKVTSTSIRIPALQHRLRLYQDAEMFAEIVPLGLEVLPLFPNDQKSEFLPILLNGATKAKQWKKANAILKLIEKMDLEDKELASFYYFAGRAQFEVSQCKESIRYYGRAMQLSPDAPEKIESKYRLAKCYLKEKRFTDAKKTWDEVAEVKDTFWSPLAQNELRMMEGK